MGQVLSGGGSSKKAETPVETVVLGAGCYWGTEKFVRKHEFASGKVVDTAVGFMGGSLKSPSYERVCGGDTGHVEVCQIKYQGDMLEELLRFFFTFHDPTTQDQQGNDRGSQYASAIFVGDARQKEVAEGVIAKLQDAMDAKGHKFRNNKVVTQVRDASEFWPAHAAHQRYLEKNPSGYCNHRMYFSTWPGEEQ